MLTYSLAQKIAIVLAVTLSPISELRGGIPVGISLGLSPWLTFGLAVIANALLFFPIYLGLHFFYNKFLSRFSTFRRILDGIQRRAKPKVDKYGYPGLTLLVAIPLPTTGVYTATILSWLLGMKWKKSFPAVGLGTLIAGVIVLLLTLGVIKGWNVLPLPMLPSS